MAELPYDMAKTLSYLSADNGFSPTATQHIAKKCGHPTANLATTRRMLAKMAQCGFVEGVRSGGKILWWRITEKGRTAMAEQRPNQSSEGSDG